MLPAEMSIDDRAGHILFCRCARADGIASDTRAAVAEALAARGRGCTLVDDLCGMAARRDPALTRLAALDDLTIVACYPRAVRWLFTWAGAPLRGEGVTFLNARTGEPGALARALGSASSVSRAEAAPHGPADALREDDGWVPWFPVIDYDRCRGCGRCLDFCLFGVYETDAEGRVAVTRPEACKTNCPACARICPQAAIIFPKFDESPINGDNVREGAALEARIRVDVDKILGSDLYQALSERRRRSKQRLVDRDRLRRAIEERSRCATGRRDGAT